MEKNWSQKAEENREFARKKMEEFAKSYQENPETIVEYLRFSKFLSVFTREYCSYLSAKSSCNLC